MTKEVIPHNVTIFPYIKEVTLRYWNQHRTTQGFPFYLGEIKGSRGLPTNNHLAPSPRAIWPSLTKAKAVFTTLDRTLFPLAYNKKKKKKRKNKKLEKQLKICQHLQTFEKSSSKSSWLTWFAIRGVVSSLWRCACSSLRKLQRIFASNLVDSFPDHVVLSVSLQIK